MITISHYDDIINNISDYFLNIHKHSNNIVSENLVSFTSNSISSDAFGRYLEKLDYEFFISHERKLSYKVKQIRKRSIDTTFGTVSFNRRIYQHKSSGKYLYYIDDIILNIIPYQRFSNELVASIFSDVTIDSYQTIASKYNISKSSIYNIISKFNHLVIDSTSHIKPTKLNTLFIQADECYVSLQNIPKSKKSNKVMIHHICVHQGIQPVCKGRNRLINKLLFTKAYNESLPSFFNRVVSSIDHLYQYDNILFYGDGANWIKSCCDEFYNSTFILDLFHTYQAVSRISNSDKYHIQILKNHIHRNDKYSFIKYVKEHLDFNNFSKYKFNNFKYLLNNWKFIQNNYSINNSCGCSQEGINFHHFASRLTTYPKGFNEANARFIAQLICCKNNSNSFNHDMLQLVNDYNTDIKRYPDINFEDNYLIKQSFIINSSKNNILRSIARGKIFN